MSKRKRKMRGKVQKVIEPALPSEPEKAREIRVENVVTDEKGKNARLKVGADVDVVIEADTDATTKKPD